MLVSSQPEAEWDDEQRAIMAALAEYRAGMCPCGCGHRMSDTTAAEGTVKFSVPTPNACLARLKLAEAQKKYAEFSSPEALLWHAVKG